MSNHDSLSDVIASSELAMKRRDWLEAVRCWEKIITASPHHVVAYAGAGNALREAGRHEDAERILAEGAGLFPSHEGIAMARAWTAHARRDWPTALSRWEDVRRRFPHNPWCYLGSIHSLQGAGRSSEIAPLADALERLLAEGLGNGKNSDSRLTLELELAKARQDWSAIQCSVRRRIAEDMTLDAKALLALAQACWHLGERDEADEAAQQAIMLDPDLADAFVVRAYVATERGDGEAALTCYRRLAALSPGAARWHLKVIQLMNRLGRMDEALSELAKVRALWPDDPMVRMFLRNYGPASVIDPGTSNADTGNDVGRVELDELRQIADKAPQPGQWKRPVIPAHAEKDVIVAEVENAEVALLVFAGSNDAVSLPLQLFDRYMAALDVTAIYLKDFNRLRFLTGIRSMSDSYAGTITTLRALLKKLGVTRLCTVGNCDGGFAAIRYGVELGAERTVTFGAPTHSARETFSRIEQARNIMAKRLAERVPPEMLDLKPFLEQSSHRTQINLFYEDEDTRDRMQALHLSRLPGVTLRPQTGLSNHYLLRKLALKDNDFLLTLAEMIGMQLAERVNQ